MKADESGTDRWWRSGLARLLFVAAGVAYGSVVALTSPTRGSSQWPVWAVLAISLAAASGAVFGYGLARWPEITEAHRPGRRAVWTHVARSYGVVLIMSLVGIVISSQSQQGASLLTGGSLGGPLLVAFAGLAALPVVAGLGAIYSRARSLDHEAIGDRAESVLALRRLLGGLLGALGSQVTLATLALGAARQVGADQPNAVVLVFGAAWSAVIAIAYAPAAGALRTAATRLCRITVPLADTERGDLPARADERHRLEEALGVERSAFADLQSGILVLSPLLASAVSLFIPD